MATSRSRDHLKALALWLIGNEPLIDYVQHRPMVTQKITEQELANRFEAGLKIAMDCSEFATLLCRLSGLADPNGLVYNGQGFTGTMLQALPHYTDPAGANVGALVVFSHPGVQTGDHVATVIGPGADPWLVSHGQNKGPARLRHSTELAAQARIHGSSTATFLNVSDL